MLRVCHSAIVVFLVLVLPLGAAESAKELFDEGVKALEKREYDLAITHFSAVLKLDPKSVAAYINRGNAHDGKGEHDKAVLNYSAAIRLDAKALLAYINRGAAYHAQRDFDRARADFDEAIRLDPNSSLAFFNRGMVHHDERAYDKAVADFSKAITLNPKDANAYSHRGASYLLQREHAKALADFQEALRLDPNDADACSDLAWIWATCPRAELRNGKKALEHARKACALTQWKEATFLDTLAASHAELGEFEEAVKWQKKALDNPDFRPQELDKARQRLKLYEQGKPFRDE